MEHCGHVRELLRCESAMLRDEFGSCHEPNALDLPEHIFEYRRLVSCTSPCVFVDDRRQALWYGNLEHRPM